MIFSIMKKDIADKLQYLMNVIPSRSNMMVLSNFMLDADSETNIVTITATDLNITTIIKIEANVVESGKILVSARQLSEIIGSLPEKIINFSIREDAFVIECANSNFTINFLEASLFPEIAFIENLNEYIINAQYFKKLIQNTAFCVASESIQSICNGIYLKIEDNLITMAGTDTKRIGEAKLTTNFTVEEPYEIVLPPRALNFIEKNIHNDSEDIIVKFDHRKISFYLKNILLISNKYEGKFPNYVVAFKQQPETELKIDKNALKDAIRRVSLLSEDEDKLIRIFIKHNEVMVETLVSDRGNAKELITDVVYDGEDSIFCLNSRLLSGFVGAI